MFSKKEVASDGRMTAGNMILSTRAKKIFKNSRVVVGMAGSLCVCQSIVDWILADMPPEDKPVLPDTDIVEYQIAFIDRKTKKLYHVEGYNIDIMEIDLPYSIGSGSEAALGYFNASGDIRASIKYAMTKDIFSGGKVVVVNV